MLHRHLLALVRWSIQPPPSTVFLRAAHWRRSPHLENTLPRPFTRSRRSPSWVKPTAQHVHHPRDWTYLYGMRIRQLAYALATTCPSQQKPLWRVVRLRKVPFESMKVWTRVLRRNSVVYAFQKLGLFDQAEDDTLEPSMAAEDSPSAKLGPRPAYPAWLLLAIPGQAKSLFDVPYLVGILYSKAFATLSPQDQGLYIARSLQAFLRVGHYVAARDLVAWWCSSPAATGSSAHRTFTRCLGALAHHPSAKRPSATAPRELLHPLRDQLLRAMRANGITPTLETYWPLFSPALIPKKPGDAVVLLESMSVDGIKWRPELVAAVTRAIAAFGGSKAAGSQQVLELAKKLETETMESKMHYAEKQPSYDGPTLTTLTPRRGSQVDPSTPSGIPTPTSSASPASSVTALRLLSDNPSAAVAYFRRLSQPDVVVWSTLFDILRNSPQITSSQIFDTFKYFLQQCEEHKHVRPSTQLWANVIWAFARRGDHRLVKMLWERSLSLPQKESGIEVDTRLFSAILWSFVADVNPEFDFGNVEALLAKHIRRPPSRNAPSFHRDAAAASVRVEPDAPLLNTVLSALNRAARPQAAFAFFKRYETEFGVLPDASTLAILLDTARYASAAAGDGYGPGSEAIQVPHRAVAPNGLWDGQPAWMFARSLAQRVLRENWPSAKIVSPVVLKLPEYRLMDWLLSPASPPRTDQAHPFAATFSPDSSPQYPQVQPTHSFFRSYIQLTGYHDTADEIPVILAWMRELGIEPDFPTLTLALMYFGEGGPSAEQLFALRKWLKEWLGETRVPSEGEVAKMRKGS